MISDIDLYHIGVASLISLISDFYLISDWQVIDLLDQ